MLGAEINGMHIPLLWGENLKHSEGFLLRLSPKSWSPFFSPLQCVKRQNTLELAGPRPENLGPQAHGASPFTPHLATSA